MAFEVEAWWSLHYLKYSLRDLNRLPVYHRFLQIRYPFEHADARTREKYTTVDEVDKYEWEDFQAHKSESFAHNRKLNRFDYSLSYHDLESPVSLTSFCHEELEGGTISRDYGSYQLHEGWSLSPPNRTYERFTTEKGVKKGFRCGLIPRGEDCERWTEEIWEQHGEKSFSKQWNREGENGGVTSNQKGEYTWGESWNSSGKGQEKKVWHKEGTKDWGHMCGSDATKRWDHTWDFSDTSKFEEKLTVSGKTDSGYRLSSTGSSWFKQEWSGPRMPSPDEGKCAAHCARTKERLNYLYHAELTATLKSEQTISSLLAYQPDYSEKARKLQAQREAVQGVDADCEDSLFAALFALRDVQSEQGKLTQELFFAMRANLGQLSSTLQSCVTAMETSLASLGRLGQVLDDQQDYHRHQSLVEAWKTTDNVSFFAKIEAAFQLIDSMEVAKREEIGKLSGGLSKSEVKTAVKTIYEIIGQSDYSLRQLAEGVSDAESFTATVEGFGDKFDTALEQSSGDKWGSAVLALLQLLGEYQPALLYFVSRVKGWGGDRLVKDGERITAALAGTQDKLSLKTVREKSKGSD